MDDQGSATWSHTYFDPADIVVQSLSTALGTPDVYEWEPGLEDFGGTCYDWTGLRVGDPNGPSFKPNPPEFFVQVTAAELSGIASTTVDGIQVGDSAPEIEARYPDSSRRIAVGDEPERLDAYLGAVEFPPADSGEPRRYTVWITASDPESTITEFRSPSEASFAN